MATVSVGNLKDAAASFLKVRFGVCTVGLAVDVAGRMFLFWSHEDSILTDHHSFGLGLFFLANLLCLYLRW